MEDFPCPYCEASFDEPFLLHMHVLELHRAMLTKNDFYRIDSHFVTAIQNFHLSIEPTPLGFSLVIYGRLEDKIDPEAKTRKEPTDEQWRDLLSTANQFVQALRIARSREN